MEISSENPISVFLSLCFFLIFDPRPTLTTLVNAIKISVPGSCLSHMWKLSQDPLNILNVVAYNLILVHSYIRRLRRIACSYIIIFHFFNKVSIEK